MSITRFEADNSDVYVYLASDGLICCGCTISEQPVRYLRGVQMIEHLRAHEAAGDHVPPHAFTELEKY